MNGKPCSNFAPGPQRLVFFSLPEWFEFKKSSRSDKKKMPKDNSIKSVLIIGSGPIVIGQACEFDYSGSQASRSLREEGIEVTLINSNPATIMTDPVVADHIYLEPLEPESIVKILEKHDIDAVLPTMGGQTALNLAIKCEEMGIWEEHNVRMIGVDTKAIDITENREAFRKLMGEIDVPMAPQATAKSFLEGKEVAQQFESLFVNMMLQAMRKATNKSELLNSQATQTYEQLFDQEIATSLSRTGSFGIAEAIERQIQIARGSDPTSFKFPTGANVKQNFSFNADENSLIPPRQRSQLQLYKEAK